MDSPKPTTLDLVRHGEVYTADLLCAASDEPLSTRGRQQLENIDSGVVWDLIVSSPSIRCSEFATQLATRRKMPLSIDPNWQEIDFGDWTGRTRQSIWETDRSQLLALWSSPIEFCAPGGESMAHFVNRINMAFDQLLLTHRGKKILLITHAGAIRAIVSHTLGIDYPNTQKFKVEHAKLNRLRIYEDGEVSLLNWACSASELK